MADPFTALLHDYGWSAVAVWFLLKEVWPALRDRLIPQYAEQKKRQQERIDQMERRQVEAIEKLSDAFQQMTTAMTINNERLTQLLGGFSEHDRNMRDCFERTKPTPKRRPQQP